MKKSALPAPLRRVIVALCDDVNSAFSAKVRKLIEDKAYDELVALRVRPMDYSTADAFRKDNVVCSLLRKCVDLPLKGNPDLRAMESWLASERACYRTNVRFQSHIHNGCFDNLQDVRVHEFMLRVRKTFRRILGPVPTELRHPKLGPGSTFNDRGLLATVPDKFTSRPTISAEARCFLPVWMETAWARNLCSELPNNSDPETINCERLTFVPKDAEKSRAISIGPSINIWLQLGVDRHIRWQLKKVGIDLDSGQSDHQLYAQVASVLGNFATIDLKSASDSVAFGLVKFLCDETWFELLNSLRMPTALDKRGRAHHLQKFSAMGNGYTFVLETLIFLAVAVTCCENSGVGAQIGKDILVYGDDIIVPTTVAADLIPVLKYMGFETNVEKTFVQGPFRESCGGDFFSGVPVRAHYLEEYPTKPSDWISLANGLRRAFKQDVENGREWGLRAWHRCLDQIPYEIRKLRIPEQLGDIGIHDEYPGFNPRVDIGSFESLSKVVVSGGVRFFRVWRPVSQPLAWHHWKPGVILASALYGVPSTGPIPRQNGEEVVSGYVFGYVPFS